MILQSDLKYATLTGSGWNIQVVDSAGNVGDNTSIALDKNNYPHIAYRDITNFDLKYAKWINNNWNIQTIDSKDGCPTSLAIDKNGYPHIVFTPSSDFTLKYAKWTGSIWDIQTVISSEWVWWCSMVLDTKGNPHIAYYKGSGGEDTQLKYVKLEDSNWKIEIVDSYGIGQYPSICLDSNDIPHISYIGRSSGLKYAKKTNLSWEIVTVDSTNIGISSIKLDINTIPNIFYYDETNGDLRYAKWILEMQQTGTLAGKVTKVDGATAISGALVEALQGGSLINQTATDGNGNYSLTLATGTYDVRASATGYQTQTKTGYTVTAGATTTVNFALIETQQTGTISGKVTKSDGTTPISGAKVEALQNNSLINQATTDTSWNYSITVATGTYDVRVSASGYQTLTKIGIIVSAGQPTPVNFALLSLTEQKPQPEYKTTLGDNLFNPKSGGSCKIKFSVPSPGKVTLKIYDLMGRHIKTLVDEFYSAGDFQKDWEGRDDNNELVPPGVYILHYQYPGGKETRKIGVKR